MSQFPSGCVLDPCTWAVHPLSAGSSRCWVCCVFRSSAPELLLKTAWADLSTYLTPSLSNGQKWTKPNKFHNDRVLPKRQPLPFPPSQSNPPASLLRHHSQPLPASGKLPACSRFHQEPQEMSLGERWSLIKNKWMGCPRHRVNEEWERKVERSWSWCPEVEDRQKERRREGKTRYIKFEPITACVSAQWWIRETKTSCDEGALAKKPKMATQIS